jgi:hypothetical protein
MNRAEDAAAHLQQQGYVVTRNLTADAYRARVTDATAYGYLAKRDDGAQVELTVRTAVEGGALISVALPERGASIRVAADDVVAVACGVVGALFDSIGLPRPFLVDRPGAGGPGGTYPTVLGRISCRDGAVEIEREGHVQGIQPHAATEAAAVLISYAAEAVGWGADQADIDELVQVIRDSNPDTQQQSRLPELARVILAAGYRRTDGER